MGRRPCREHRKAALEILSWRESAACVAGLAASTKPTREGTFTHRLTSCSSFSLLIYRLQRMNPVETFALQLTDGCQGILQILECCSSSHICVTICSSLFSELIHLCALCAFFAQVSPCFLLERLAGGIMLSLPSGTISSSLGGERDYHTVVHLGNPVGGTGRIRRCFYLRI